MVEHEYGLVLLVNHIDKIETPPDDENSVNENHADNAMNDLIKKRSRN